MQIDAEATLIHAPVRPPRQGFLREHVYAGRWSKLMHARRGALSIVLCDCSTSAGQREAAVAASVVTWLGTNIGQALLEDASLRLASSPRLGRPRGAAESDAYLSAWAAENRRKRGVNGGIRTLEAILCEPSQGAWAAPSAYDYEVADHVMYWLGQYDGSHFVEECQAECAALGQIHSLGCFLRCGLMHLSPAQELLEGLAQYETTGEVAACAARALRDEMAAATSLL